MLLASASPRRRELLEDLGFALTVHPADVDESRLPGEDPLTYVTRLARAKAHAVLAACGPLPTGEALLAADTIVHQGTGATYGKPASTREAAAMLRALSGVTHQVSTGVCIMVAAHDGSAHDGNGAPCDGATVHDGNAAHDGDGATAGMLERTFADTTDVTFFPLTDAEIDAYVASGEPADKAGAYGVQATGRLLVREIRGDYFNVVGLPVTHVVRVLDELGYGGGGLTVQLLGRRGA